jgi:hypothetical protein
MGKTMALFFRKEIFYDAQRLNHYAYNLALRVKIGSSKGANDEKKAGDKFTFSGFQPDLKRLR